MDQHLSEELLTESLNHHKLRNVAQKVAKLNPHEDQITREILKQFCPKIEQTTTSTTSNHYSLIRKKLQYFPLN